MDEKRIERRRGTLNVKFRQQSLASIDETVCDSLQDDWSILMVDLPTSQSKKIPIGRRPANRLQPPCRVVDIVARRVSNLPTRRARKLGSFRFSGTRRSITEIRRNSPLFLLLIKRTRVPTSLTRYQRTGSRKLGYKSVAN